jgi:hypothetical protein
MRHGDAYQFDVRMIDFYIKDILLNHTDLGLWETHLDDALIEIVIVVVHIEFTDYA